MGGKELYRSARLLTRYLCNSYSNGVFLCNGFRSMGKSISVGEEAQNLTRLLVSAIRLSGVSKSVMAFLAAIADSGIVVSAYRVSRYLPIRYPAIGCYGFDLSGIRCRVSGFHLSRCLH